MLGRLLDLRYGDSDLQRIWGDLDPTQRHASQVATDQALLDGRELRLVGLHE
jgi:hypothetical protein